MTRRAGSDRAGRPPGRLRSDLALLASSTVRAARDIAGRRIHQPSDHVGRRLHFADGTSACVYRETVIDGAVADEPAVLVVTFRLRGVRASTWHAMFRWESLANTVLFVGFPGFASKLWCAHDDTGAYRGLYQWDGARRAESYVAALRRVLGLVSDPGSIRHEVLDGIVRDDLLADPTIAVGAAPGSERAWWRLVDVDPACGPTT